MVYVTDNKLIIGVNRKKRL